MQHAGNRRGSWVSVRGTASGRPVAPSGRLRACRSGFVAGVSSGRHWSSSSSGPARSRATRTSRIATRCCAIHSGGGYTGCGRRSEGGSGGARTVGVAGNRPAWAGRWSRCKAWRSADWPARRRRGSSACTSCRCRRDRDRCVRGAWGTSTTVGGARERGGGSVSPDRAGTRLARTTRARASGRRRVAQPRVSSARTAAR
jgi:hypothetical protein